MGYLQAVVNCVKSVPTRQSKTHPCFEQKGSAPGWPVWVSPVPGASPVATEPGARWLPLLRSAERGAPQGSARELSGGFLGMCCVPGDCVGLLGAQHRHGELFKTGGGGMVIANGQSATGDLGASQALPKGGSTERCGEVSACHRGRGFSMDNLDFGHTQSVQVAERPGCALMHVSSVSVWTPGSVGQTLRALRFGARGGNTSLMTRLGFLPSVIRLW